MSKGIFTDKEKKPDARSIGQAIGPAKKNWSTLTDFLDSELKTRAS